MSLFESTDQSAWNEFVAVHSSPSSFLQSYQWGEFQQSLGHKVHRLTLPGRLQAQVIVKPLLFGWSYLEIPKGPVIREVNGDPRAAIGDLVERLKEIAKPEQAVLARINPSYEKLPDLADFGFRTPEILLRQREPERTILVDLSKTEDELLANMHEKSRYNIRLASRRGVKVRLATEDRPAFAQFLQLLEETAKRDGIVSWEPDRFWKFREEFMGNRTDAIALRAELLIGEFEGQVLAAAVVMLFGNSGTYLYAASSGQDRSANVPSLVLWEAIKLSKARGKRWYDMWGVAPANDPGHPWAGITRFKSRYVNLGVTGKDQIPPGTRDLILRPAVYRLLKIAKRLRG